MDAPWLTELYGEMDKRERARARGRYARAQARAQARERRAGEEWIDAWKKGDRIQIGLGCYWRRDPDRSDE